MDLNAIYCRASFIYTTIRSVQSRSFSTSYHASACGVSQGHKAGLEQQEGVLVAPAEREHAEALHVRVADVVVDMGQQGRFFGVVMAEQEVIDDEDIPTLRACQWYDDLLIDGRA